MLKDQLHDRRITVAGAARSGLYAAMLLQSKGADVLLTDLRPEPLTASDTGLLARQGIKTVFGTHEHVLSSCDALVLSPGISLDSPLVKEAKKKGLPVLGELETASWFSRAPLAAVTGSNGKTTTTALLAAMISKSGRPCVLAGNIGDSFSKMVEATVPEGVAVLEVSSFQLETIDTFHPRTAVFLNLTPDHLDRHGSMENYGRLKARIFENQTAADTLVYNGADGVIRNLVRRAAAVKMAFGTDKGDNCGFVKEGSLFIRLGGSTVELLPAAEMQLTGEHNQLNALAAALAAASLGTPFGAIRSVLSTFTSLPHRLEPAGSAGGVTWINDSKATNVDAVWYALGGFSQPVILIAGGRDKDSDFSQLRERVAAGVKKLILLGEAAEKMALQLKGAAPIIRVKTLKEAVMRAKEAAEKGDVVLLSPACASFDMFRSYEDRGEQFKTLVRELGNAV